MSKDLKDKIWHVVLTALGVGLAAMLTYLSTVVKSSLGA